MIFTVRSRPYLLLAGICFLGVVYPLFAYGSVLSDRSVREAYLLGSARNEETTKFLAQYIHHFPVPPSGPNISEIRLETPFAQVARRANEMVNYTDQDAEQQFRGKSLPVRISAKIYFTPSFTDILRSGPDGTVLRGEGFWKDFKVQLVQGQNVIPANTTGGHAIFDSAQENAGAMIGAEVYADYAAQRISSEAAKVQVIGPKNTTTEATFDLSKLR